MLRRIELEILATVERGNTISELATKLDHSESYLSRAVGDLVEKGLASTERDGRYDFNGDFHRLHEFARGLAHHPHRQCLEAVAPNGTILQEDHDEFLAQTESEAEAEHFHET